jgi:hypothetical protein
MLTDVKKSKDVLTVTGLSSESATVVGPSLCESCTALVTIPMVLFEFPSGRTPH